MHLTGIKDCRKLACDEDGMHRYIPELASRWVPRYTSYPTAVEFHDRVGVAEGDVRRGQGHPSIFRLTSYSTYLA